MVMKEANWRSVLTKEEAYAIGGCERLMAHYADLRAAQAAKKHRIMNRAVLRVRRSKEKAECIQS
jgi:uncharacterized ParB-like nuclease family protein